MSPSSTVVEPRGAVIASPGYLVQFLVAYCRLLAEGYEAREAGRARGPVGCLGLVRSGVSDEVLLWMLFQGHVDHLEQAGGDWRPRASAVLGDGSGFALTHFGEAFGELLIEWALLPESARQVAAGWALLRVGELTPRYDKEDRLLTWGRAVLKRFRQPSDIQEVILLAAEELGWPQWFDDPLPRAKYGNPKVRLHDAIKRLNRHQETPVVHFCGDGTGRRVGWGLR